MAAQTGCSSSVVSLPPPLPKSPPRYPDLCGKRGEMGKIQMLEKQIGFLEEELEFVEGLQPASRCCKEVTNFVVEKSDPLIHTNKKNRRSWRFWKWLCGSSCFSFSWICCCCRCCCCDDCSFHLEKPNCCDCNPCKCHLCVCCRLPKWQCCSCPRFHCCKKISCSRNCCIFRFPSCPSCSCSCSFSCCRCKCCCPKCPMVRNCFTCKKTCCNPCYYLCY